MSLNGRHVGERALVLGGSMAGLFAGHALAEHFREVLIVDRDQLVGVTGLVCLATPRITLENRVRERVRALPNVTFLEYTDVLGLVTTPDQSRVVGARIRRRAGATARAVTVAANGTRGASGRHAAAGGSGSCGWPA